mgnify:CR=1 FL=1
MNEALFTANNLWLLVATCLVFVMHLGFAALEAGFVQRKNTVNILFKNCMILSIGLLTYYMMGFNLMYPGAEFTGGYFGFAGFGITMPEGTAGAIDYNNGTYTYYTDFIFQAMFAATAATIVSGAIAGRTKYSTYVIFSIVMTAIIYPISGGWQWQGSGWLTELGFIDFAGSSIVHSVGGWAALVAAILVGPRIGKFLDGKVMPIPGHNQVLATLGVFILWLGWFGFNGGSQLAWGGADAIGASNVVLITNLAAAAGGLGALITTWIWYGKPHLAQTLNGALAGLVSITAGCGNMSSEGAALAGLLGGILVVFSIEFIEKKLKIDDAIGAVSVHGVVGVWGTVVIGLWGIDGDTGIGLFNGGGTSQLSVQALGSLAYAVWAIALSWIVLFTLKKTIGLRVSQEVEEKGSSIFRKSLDFGGGSMTQNRKQQQ